jgi:glycosyltransferase involved in cell wall biosynthesis
MITVPVLSVLLPCRNAEETVDTALESLVAQTFDNFEIIAVDDGSTDSTGDQLARWAKRDGRVHLVRRPPLGIVAALNAAAEVSRGELFARMDADDIAHPLRFERQLELLERRPEIAACGTRIRYFPRSIVRDGARRYEEWINSVVTADDIDRDMFVECPIPHPTLVVRRTAFEQVGRYRDNEWPEDYDLILRLWQEGQGLGKVPEELLEWRESPTRLSRTNPRYDESAFRGCKAHFLRKRIANRKVVVCGAGPVGKSFALALQSEGHTIAAFVDLDPRKIGQMIHGAPVIHQDDVLKYRGCFVLAAVGSSRGRANIRAHLIASGFDEPDEFCAVA